VRSSDYKQVYFVAAELDGSGLSGSGDVAVWATNNIRQTRAVYAVNVFARDFSDWFDGRRTQAQISLADDGAREAQQCVGDA
jgi:hypothetical protein